MSVAEVIAIIDKLPPAEQREVSAYLDKKKQAAGERTIRYISNEKFDEVVPKVFEKHDELFRRLAQ